VTRWARIGRFLGGSPPQIAEDLARLEGSGVDHVLFANTATSDLVRLLEELQAAVGVRT
jgi:alkanesulfonate monooxygenase SsuD/methylene tetrahydromethanopterin reductase-like flavin-dependent oxidoreductase (luciferase family)